MLTSVASGQAVVDRVGPPSWWSTASDQTVTLLVEGSRLQGASIRFADGPLRTDHVEVNSAGTAAFVDVMIPASARPRQLRLIVSVAGRQIERPWDLVAAPVRPAAAVTPDDVIYLVMPDRFGDGDPGNNAADTVGDSMLDRRDPHAYHGGDFAGLRAKLPYLADLGVTALWLTPIYHPAPRWYGPGRPGAPRYADFHGYSPVDFYDTNPRFGTLAEYRQLVAEAHRLGLKVIQDQLLGFCGPQHPWVKAPPTPTWFNGPLDHPPSCDFRFESATDPHATEAARRRLTDGWFIGILPDMNLREPRPATYAIQQSLWWAVLSEADGIRLDTYPMVDRSFWPIWARRLQQARPGIQSIGEAWMNDPSMVAFFQGGRAGWDGIDPGVAGVFDFPLHAAINKVFSGEAKAVELTNVLARDFVYPRPDLLTTLLDNHDTIRLAALKGVTPRRLRLAAAFLLTNRGVPQLTWGDEVGLLGNENDRRDYPGGYPGDPRSAFDPATRTPDEAATFNAYRTLLHLRRENPALRRGRLAIIPTPNPDVYLATRTTDKQAILIALNLGVDPTTVPLPPDLVPIADRIYGDAQRQDRPNAPALALPGESATLFRTR